MSLATRPRQCPNMRRSATRGKRAIARGSTADWWRNLELDWCGNLRYLHSAPKICRVVSGLTPQPTLTGGIGNVRRSRLHVQVLLIDDKNGPASRFAHGALEQVANWNGAGSIIFGECCGLHGEPFGSLATAASLSSHAEQAGVDTRHLTKSSNAFSRNLDPHLHDLLLCTSESVESRALEASREESDRADGSVALLARFGRYYLETQAANGLSDVAKGKTLPGSMSRWLETEEGSAGLERAFQRDFVMPDVGVDDIRSPGAQVLVWELLASAIVNAAGLTRFVLDTNPVEMLERRYFGRYM